MLDVTMSRYINKKLKFQLYFSTDTSYYSFFLINLIVYLNFRTEVTLYNTVIPALQFLDFLNKYTFEKK